jgi:hypothetical protein
MPNPAMQGFQDIGITHLPVDWTVGRFTPDE